MNTRTCISTLALMIVLSQIHQSVYGMQQELLEEVRIAHQTSIASIQTFVCDVSISYNPIPLGGSESGKYWRSGEVVRCQSESKAGKDDVLVQGDRLICVNKYPFGGRNPETSGTIIENKIPIKCDAWSYGLLTFYGREKFRVKFDELLEQPHKVHSVKRIQEDGRELVYVDISHDRARLEIWFDPKMNYLVRKVAMETAGPEKERLRSEERVVSFKEAAPGLFFPARVDTRSLTAGRPAVTMSVTFSNIQANQQLPNDIFKLRFPPGIIVTDLIQDKILKADSQGEPTLPATNSQGKPLHLSKGAPIPLAATAEGAERYRVTQEEPRSWTPWLLPISLTFLVCAGFLWVFGKWRRRARSV